jgi:arylsulfatase A-like enzyme
MMLLIMGSVRMASSTSPGRRYTAWPAVLLTALVMASSCRDGGRPASSGASPQSASVILVSIDTLRADRLNAYGYEKRVTSPNLDALAREGILFENFITAAPWTTPAHLSLLTSLHPCAHGVIQPFGTMYRNMFNGGEFLKLPDRRVTLAEVLRHEHFKTAAFTAGGPLDPKIGFGQGFDEYSTSMYKLNEENVGEMFSWLEENRDDRFFLFWHHFEVHAPYLNADFLADVLPAETAAGLKEETMALANVPLKRLWPGGASKQREKQKNLLRQRDAFTAKVCDALYTGGVRSADRWFGRLVKVLRETGLYDRTLIIVTSDHGEQLGERLSQNFYNMHGHKVFDEMIRVPLIIRLPHGAGAGSRVRQVTRTVDIMPTVLDYLGLRPNNPEMQGASLVPYWTDPKNAPERLAYTEALATWFEKKSVRTSRYKYVLHVPGGLVRRFGRGTLPDRPLRAQLFDLQEDPGERNNLLRGNPSPEVKRVADQLDRMLRDHVARNQGQAEPTRLDQEAIEKLEALGYLSK